MKHHMKFGAWCVAAVGVAALFVSCSSSSTDNPSGSAATIDLASVTTGITEMSSIIPVCHTGSNLMSAVRSGPATGNAAWLDKLLALRYDRTLRAALKMPALTSTKPADVLGDCGGRITYPVYNHSNGVTTGTYAYQNYCSVDSETGEKSIQNGSVTFTNTGTPSANGPITNKIEASSPDGISFITQSSTGAQLTSQKFSFTNYVYTAGVPGGSPTASSPNRITADELKIADLVSGKTYRQTNYSITDYITASGGDNLTISGRGYRSNGDYFDMATTSPLTTNSDGDTTGGQISFTGAGNSVAVLTVVPGSTLQGTMTVNGTPVTNVPACR